MWCNSSKDISTQFCQGFTNPFLYFPFFPKLEDYPFKWRKQTWTVIWIVLFIVAKYHFTVLPFQSYPFLSWFLGYILVRILINRGTWVAQSGKHLTLVLGSGRDLIVRGFKPHVRLCADRAEPAWDSVSLSLFLSLSVPPCSLPLKNK